MYTYVYAYTLCYFCSEGRHEEDCVSLYPEDGLWRDGRCDAWNLRFLCNSGLTQSPTTNPTAQPTYPSASPTTDPTVRPSNIPSSSPTTDPTLDPSNDPTVDPTSDPTVDPTINPTSVPTAQPTTNPSSYPTIDPTTQPTTDPSRDPTADPTIDPTTDPTSNPSVEPTADPTQDPTWDPSKDPTFDPTNDPTVNPSADPTIHPTVDPTQNPTEDSTHNPSPNPTLSPNIRSEGQVGDNTYSYVPTAQGNAQNIDTKSESTSISTLALLGCGLLLLITLCAWICFYCVYRKRKMKKLKQDIANIAAETNTSPTPKDVDNMDIEHAEGGSNIRVSIESEQPNVAECSELKQWLQKMGLVQYYTAFVENGFDKQLIAVTELNDSDLQQIGVLLMGHRKLILREIRLLTQEEQQSPKKVNIDMNLDMLHVNHMQHNIVHTPTAADDEGMYVCNDDDEEMNETAAGPTAGGIGIVYDRAVSDDKMY